jgi:hypothetical protein
VRKQTRGIVLALALGIAAIQAHSQSSIQSTATVVGYVADQTGANIPKATITLIDINKKGAPLRTSSNDYGSFSIRASIGDYIFTVTSDGFAIHKK